jgi:hypothetical protein
VQAHRHLRGSFASKSTIAAWRCGFPARTHGLPDHEIRCPVVSRLSPSGAIVHQINELQRDLK